MHRNNRVLYSIPQVVRDRTLGEAAALLQVRELRAQLRAACLVRDLLAERVAELQAELTAQCTLTDELAAELERVYALQDQGSEALAVLGQTDVCPECKGRGVGHFPDPFDGEIAYRKCPYCLQEEFDAKEDCG